MVCHLYGKQYPPSSSPTRLLSVFVGEVDFSYLTCICACCPSLPSTHALENQCCALSFRLVRIFFFQVHRYSLIYYFYDDNHFQDKVHSLYSLHSTTSDLLRVRIGILFLPVSLIEAPLVKHAFAGGWRGWRREASQDHGAPGAVLRRSVVVIFGGDFWSGFRFASWASAPAAYYMHLVPGTSNSE